MSSEIFIGMGSNIGDRAANLAQAEALLGFPVIRKSSLYETEPVGFLNQPWFVNNVVQIATDLSPHQLLDECRRVENQLGRVRDIPKGPRTIDLDILFYGRLILDDPDLIIPHPAVADRRFVLEPMNEIASQFVHPILDKTILKLLAICPDRSAVRLFEPLR